MTYSFQRHITATAYLCCCLSSSCSIVCSVFHCSASFSSSSFAFFNCLTSSLETHRVSGTTFKYRHRRHLTEQLHWKTFKSIHLLFLPVVYSYGLQQDASHQFWRLLLTYSLLNSLSWRPALSSSNWLRCSLRTEISSLSSVIVPTETTASVAMVKTKSSVGVTWTHWSNRQPLFAEWACLLLSSSLWQEEKGVRFVLKWMSVQAVIACRLFCLDLLVHADFSAVILIFKEWRNKNTF